MKTITQTMLLLLLSFTALNSFAQSEKSIFPSFPQAIEISQENLKNALSVTEGMQISIPFNSNFTFSGTVISNEMKYANLQSMMIRSSINNKIVFQLSKIINKNNSIKYVGRIIDPSTNEVFEIKNEKQDSYTLQKNDLKKILQDCSY
jgi:hypothetical protein